MLVKYEGRLANKMEPGLILLWLT